MGATVTPIFNGGRNGWLVEFSETNVAAGHELVVPIGCGKVVTITDFAWSKDAGAGATITPALGWITGHGTGTKGRIIAHAAAANGHVGTLYRECRVVAGKLFLQLEPNAGADNTVTGAFVVYDGHLA